MHVFYGLSRYHNTFIFTDVVVFPWLKGPEHRLVLSLLYYTTKSIRQGSFFSKSKLTLQKWFIVMIWWSQEYPVTEMAQEAEIANCTACDIYQWLQEVCSTKLLRPPIVLGGPGVIVEIDESQFKHKPKVYMHE